MVRPAGSPGYRPMEWYTGGGPLRSAAFRQQDALQARSMPAGWRIQATVAEPILRH